MRFSPRILPLIALAFSVFNTPLPATPSLGLPVDIVTDSPAQPGAFALVVGGRAAPLWCDPSDHSGVRRAVGDLQTDIEQVTGRRAEVVGALPSGGEMVLVGTIGRSTAIDALVASGKLADADLRGKWEAFVITTIEAPFPGVDRALVIAGSDKRGTIYGIYELSEQLGVSPWYWWADVPPKKRAAVYVLPGRFTAGEPVVKYRGIFLNDEAPCLTGWAAEKFGGLNSKFYTKVFELLLRLRANYLWPAMWDNAFNEDDPLNPKLADEYGIVMGTSHHEPMMRAHKEWTKRRADYGNGKWNYATNAGALQRFFREGIARNKTYENLVTVGMRGDGDEGMVSTGGIESDIRQLEQIFADQRRILADELGTDPERVPQLWALFTEVQKFYEAGLRPPDDVTLLWTDDNTGNLRRLPTPDELGRSGGSGIYYHFDMHGGPYAYQWINTNPLPKIAEQMNLAAEYGATRIWIVNVGDLKPLELPIEFFLRMAWNPAALNKDRVAEYTRRWAERDFGPEHAEEIADLTARYAKFNGWRKPEQITPATFSPLYYREAETVEAAWRDVSDRAEALYARLPEAQRDAFYQLVLYPAKASALVAQMNILAGRNALHAKQGRASTNALARRVRELFDQDGAMRDYYNRTLSGGKWNHLMDQTHLGQWSWEPPVVDVMPAVSEVRVDDVSRVGVAVEGDQNVWPDHYGSAVLPVLDSISQRGSYFDVFAMGSRAVDYEVVPVQPWLVVTENEIGEHDRRYMVGVDWAKVPEGASVGLIQVVGARTAQIRVPVVKATVEQARAARGCFASLTGPIAFAASAAANRIEVGGTRWETVPDYGRGEDAVTVYPVTAPSILPPAPAPTLEYPVYLPRSGTYTVTLVLGPAMDFAPDRGVRIGVSFGDEPVQVVDLFADREAETFLGRNWGTYTRDNARYVRSTHTLATDGWHLLKLTMVDPAVLVQKIIVSDKKLPESYFGPPESGPLE